MGLFIAQKMQRSSVSDKHLMDMETMSRVPLISPERLFRIEKRQSIPRWQNEYEPAMKATRDEAPSISRPSTLFWSKIGRDLHFMSLAERHVCILALYHPGLIDVHEQHALERFDAPHPLADHPRARHLRLPPLRGTVSITEEMGIPSAHPVVNIPDKSNSNNTLRAAFPFIGDLLLFMVDDIEPYCVNWSIKTTRTAFYDKKVATRNAKSRLHDCALSDRHLIEQRYFADAGIASHFIAADEFDSHLIANLNALCAKAQQPIILDWQRQEELIVKFQKIVGTRTTPLAIMEPAMRQIGCSRQDFVAILYSAIWNRRVRVDLYQPVLVDKPLKAERRDVLVDYAHLFSRGQ
tara:strand:- start:20115 stop:21167 length:1053 start_codon:yes stop_codon:yes gene_type:complete